MERCLDLIFQYCNDPDPARQAEYDQCVRRNLANPHIRALHNLTEPGVQVPLDIAAHPKHRRVHVHRRLRYLDAFEFANMNLPGRAVCLCNLDIFLDPNGSWLEAAQTARQNVVLCLSRHELDENANVYVDPDLSRRLFCNSQDAWIWQAPLEVPDSDFELGRLGCDNAIAERFNRTGRIPINAPSRFRIYHLDRVRGKTFANQQTVHGTSSPRADERGHLLLPDIDRLRDFEQLLREMGVPDLPRYVAMCEVLSKLMRTSPQPISQQEKQA